MEPFGVKAVATAGIICSAMAVRAVRKKSLTVPGAIAGFCTGFLMVCTGLRGLVLFYFYQIGSWATKYKVALKCEKDATLASHVNRGATQVLCVSIIACALSLWHAVACGAETAIDFVHHPTASRIATAITAHHATGLADTLASELGILARYQQPVLITRPWQRVPPGTNGGITVAGCIWSLVGGAMIGILTVLMDCLSGLEPWTSNYAVPLTLYAAVTGLLGSLLDSLLGATLQATYWDADTKLIYHSDNKPATAQHLTGIDLLTNEQVNLVSTALTVVAGGWILAPLIIS
jgi:uncharacterized protein (TIGR00297 family)